MRLMVLLMAQCFTMLNVCNPFIDFLLVIRVALLPLRSQHGLVYRKILLSNLPQS